MGLFDRLRRSNGTPEALTASGAKINLQDTKAAEQMARRREQWQERAWDSYDEIPQIWFSTNYISNVLRRVRLFPAVQPDPQAPPVPLDSAVDGAIAVRAALELNRLASDDGTHGNIMHDLAMQLTIPGEGYLVGDEDPETGEEHWGIYSTSELVWDPSEQRWLLKQDPNDRQGQRLTENAFAGRIWRRHPRFRMMADSGLRAVLDECDELQILNRYFRSTSRSRLNMGMLFMPQEITFPKRADEDTSPLLHPDPMINALLQMAMTPIQEEGSASAVVPGVMKIKGDWIEKIRHLTFARDYDDKAMQRQEYLLRQIAAGIDLPSEITLGIADLNHWSAFQISEDAFDDHLAPLCAAICSGITEAYYKPALSDTGRTDLIVWYDASDVIAHPNRSSDADAAHDRLVISDESYRRYKGYNEDDAPDDAEVQRRIEQAKALKPGAPPGGDQGGGAPAIVAAAGPDLASLGMRLRDIDFNLRLQMQAAAQGVVFRALERAGAKLRRKASNDPVFGPLIKDVPNHEVSLVLGADVVSKWFQAEEPNDLIAPIIGQFGTAVARAQKQVRGIIEDFDPEGKIDYPALANQQDEQRSAAIDVLAAGLAGVVAGRLFSPAAAEPGEFDASVTVPPGVLREALSVAGGGNAVATDTPDGGIATGTTALDVFNQLGLTPSSWTWVYGDSGSRTTPFPGHENLDGVDFQDWQDPVLAINDEDAWLGVDFYFPGDHRWCQCDFAPTFEDNTDQAAQEA